MKRYLIIFAAALCLLGISDLNAQERYRRERHGRSFSFNNDTGIALSVGYLHSGYRSRNWTNEEVVKDKGLNGLYVEVSKDFAIVRKALYFQTGLTYTYQNSNNRFSEAGIKLVSDRNEHYLDIPLRLKFKLNVTPNLRAFIYAGPTMDFGLSATMQYRSVAEGSSELGKIKYNYFTGKTKTSTAIAGFQAQTPASPFRRFDVLMGGAIGVELYDIAEVKLGFDWGLINKNKNKAVADYLTTHRNLFHLGVGIRF